MGCQIEDKCVIISTLTCMHSRAVLLEKELMNPLLQTIRKVHLSSVNKGKLPLKLQLFRWLYRTNSILRLSPAAGVPKDHQNVMKGSFRQEESFPPYPCGGSSTAQTWDSTWCIRNRALLVYSKLQHSASFRVNETLMKHHPSTGTWMLLFFHLRKKRNTLTFTLCRGLIASFQSGDMAK